MTGRPGQRTGVLIVAHGERGGDGDNGALHNVCAAVAEATAPFSAVLPAVLNGSPSLQDGVAALAAQDCGKIVVYPFFMSGGYFAKTRLPELFVQAGSTLAWRMLDPLGLDEALPQLIGRHVLDRAAELGWPPPDTRLLIVGHGSAKSRASAEATNAVAARLREQSSFGRIEAAFLEEAPLLTDVLNSSCRYTIVAGFFAGEGLHSREDVPAALCGTSHHYLGAVGAWSDTAILIATRVRAAVAATVRL